MNCQPINCGAPSSPDNGSVTGRNFNFNRRVKYQCDIGYTLVGEEIRTCTAIGDWSGIDPVCEPVSCGDLEDITNGKVCFS